jgi:starvation-inducible DNA-binding protein
MAVNIGLSNNARKVSAEWLGRVLADSYLLYVKTQNFHWNVTGPHFGELHKMFGDQYEALADAIDEIAERIRALGHQAPGSMAAFQKLGSLGEAKGELSAKQMIEQLVEDNEAVTRLAREAKDAAEKAGDSETGDLLIERMQEHAKAAWMLRVQLE